MNVAMQVMRGRDLLHRVLEEERPVGRLEQVAVEEVHLLLTGPALGVPVLERDPVGVHVPRERTQHVLVRGAAEDAVGAEAKVHGLEGRRAVAAFLEALLALP